MGHRGRGEGQRRLGEILIEEGLVRPDKLDEVLRKQKRLGQLLVDEGLISLEELCLALQRQTDELGRAAKVFDDTSRLLKDSPFLKDGLDPTGGGASEILFLLDPEGTVRAVNPAARSLLGYEESEMVGQPVEKVLPEAAGLVSGALADPGAPVSLEAELIAKEGSPLTVWLTCSPVLDEKGGVQGLACLARDITERRRAEEALRATSEELQRQVASINQAQERLIHAEKLASVGLLTADVSHEILNPLNIITMRIQMMLASPATPPEMVRHLKTLEDQANRIAKISQNLLSFARRRPPERRQLDLNAIARRTLELLEHKLKKENVAVELELAESLPLVWADEDQIQQVVFNLLTNARDAMPAGGRLRLQTRAVEAGGAPLVELRVEDSGEGISPEHLDKLFDPFFTTKPEGVGTGLGLSICQSIVRAHGGSIWAENASQGGAAFSFRLAVQEPRRPREVLVVDDEPLICDLLQEFLVEKGYRAIIAKNGDEALEAYKRSRPDVVLLDLLLPGKNGLEVLRDLKALDPEVAVFIVTALREEEVHREAKAEGVLGCFTKPIDTDHLAWTLKTEVSLPSRLN